MKRDSPRKRRSEAQSSSLRKPTASSRKTIRDAKSAQERGGKKKRRLAPFGMTMGRGRPGSVLSNQLDHHPPSDHGGRPLQAGKRDVVVRIKEPVNLGAAGLEQWRHLIFGYFLFLHGLVELPSDDFLDRLCLRLFKDALFLQEIINARTHAFLAILALLALLAHRFNSFWRLRAKAKSSSGVARVFLINPCNATRCSS